MSLVNPGVVETRAKTPLPASMFNSDDLPTFERPMKANSGNDSSGHESKSGALRSKMADEMFTMKKPIIHYRSKCVSVIQPISKRKKSQRGAAVTQL
jgi:hypothetical protein